MSQILKDLNKLAAKMGAPVVGRNISEQVRSISTYYEGTSHGANIAERINEVAHSNIGGGSSVLISKTINQNGIYLATDDAADGYSDVKVNVQPTLATKSITANGTYNASSDEVDGYSSVNVDVPQEKWLRGHGSEYIVIPATDLNMTSYKTDVFIKFKLEDNELAINENTGLYGRWTGGLDFCLRHFIENGRPHLTLYSSNQSTGYDIKSGADVMYAQAGNNRYLYQLQFHQNGELIGSTSLSYLTTPDIRNLDIPVFVIFNSDNTIYGKPVKAKIACFRIYDDNTLKFNGTPAIDPTTNKACLYDSVNNKYYGNVNAESQTDFEIVTQ